MVNYPVIEIIPENEDRHVLWENRCSDWTGTHVLNGTTYPDCPIEGDRSGVLRQRGIMINRNPSPPWGCGHNVLAFLNLLSIHNAKQHINNMYENEMTTTLVIPNESASVDGGRIRGREEGLQWEDMLRIGDGGVRHEYTNIDGISPPTGGIANIGLRSNINQFDIHKIEFFIQQNNIRTQIINFFRQLTHIIYNIANEISPGQQFRCLMPIKDEYPNSLISHTGILDINFNPLTNNIYVYYYDPQYNKRYPIAADVGVQSAGIDRFASKAERGQITGISFLAKHVQLGIPNLNMENSVVRFGNQHYHGQSVYGGYLSKNKKKRYKSRRKTRRKRNRVYKKNKTRGIYRKIRKCKKTKQTKRRKRRKRR